MVRAYGALTIVSGRPATGCTRLKPTSIHAVYSTAILAPSWWFGFSLASFPVSTDGRAAPPKS